MCKLETAKKPLPKSSNGDDDDHRPLIKDLLEEHASVIENVQEKIRSDEEIDKSLYDPERYDDIWILRYVLSHKGNAKNAAKAALKTMKFRDDEKLNEKTDLRYCIKNYSRENENDKKYKSLPGYDRFNAKCGKEAIIHFHPDPDRGLLFYCQPKALDTDGVMADITEEEFREAYIAMKEAEYQILDEVTRRTGRLTKLTRFVDLHNYSFFKFNRKYTKLDADIQKELEDFFPQSLDKQYIFNIPSWLSAIWTVIAALFPKRLIEKLDICPSSASTKFYAPIAKHVSEENHPVGYGGKNTNWPPPSIAELQSDKMSSK